MGHRGQPLRAWLRKVSCAAAADRGPGVEPGMLRPFTEADLAPIEDGREVGPPDFVGVGCGKAGTGWWYWLIVAHPQVVQNRLSTKELQYFYHFGYEGISDSAVAAYRSAFARPDGCLCGEWSPGYLTYPLATTYLATAAAETKILVMVRNPIDRMLSGLNQVLSVRAKFLGLVGQRAEVLRRFSLFPASVSESILAQPFERIYSLFDPSQVLVLQYEKCKQDPMAELRRTYRFLGLDDTFVPDALTSRVNRQPYLVSQLTDPERKLLADYYAADVRRLVRDVPGIDVGLWPDFRL